MPVDLAAVYTQEAVWTDTDPNSDLYCKPYVMAVLGEWEIRDYGDDFLRVFYVPRQTFVDAMHRNYDPETWVPASLALAAQHWFQTTEETIERRYP